MRKTLFIYLLLFFTTSLLGSTLNKNQESIKNWGIDAAKKMIDLHSSDYVRSLLLIAFSKKYSIV